MPKKILIATGGTGGHIYPAMALAQQFSREQKDSKVLFIGGGLSENRYFDKAAFPFREVACSSFLRKSPLAILRAISKIIKGILQSRAIIREFKPDIVVGFGSFYSFPPLIAAKIQAIPFILHEANAIPGKVNQLLAPFAAATGVHFPQTLDLIKGTKYEVGMPLRNAFSRKEDLSSEVKDYFALSEEAITLLVFGGSQGSNAINRHVLGALKLYSSRDQDCDFDRAKAPGLADRKSVHISNIDRLAIDQPRELSHGSKSNPDPGWSIINHPKPIQVIHIAGDAQQMETLSKGYQDMGIRACVKAFEDRMDLAWHAADLVISRAGASSIAEQLEMEVPGILIPFPKAADDHQNHNADFLVRTVGGAVKIRESELRADRLAELIMQCLQNSEKMKSAMSLYKQTVRKQDLYSLINKYLG